MAYAFFVLLVYLIAPISLWAFPQYYCTGANSKYFDLLLNLIGSIHRTNYQNLEEIAIFDFGLKESELQLLNTISKVKIYKIQQDNPHLLTFYYRPDSVRPCLGWYMWKPVVIKEILDVFPYVFWMDAASGVLTPLDNLFAHIEKKGYFLATIGEGANNRVIEHPIGWSTTSYVKEFFHLNNPANAWVLDQELIIAGLVGVSKKSYSLFLKEWFEMTDDILLFADDGTAPGGYGRCRHDQTILSIIANLNGLEILSNDDMLYDPPYIVGEEGKEVPFYTTWRSNYQRDKANVLVQTGSFGSAQNIPCIKFKNLSNLPF
ncbi:MAG TPA: hypothetical protein VGJ00_05530 [Rhabdochlamydiaceae bacterium]|jgi:hypothetical protein